MLAEAVIGIAGATRRQSDDGSSDLSGTGGSGLSALELVVIGAEEEGAGRRLNSRGPREEPLLGVWA